MDVYPPDATTMQLFSLHQLNRLIMFRQRWCRQSFEKRKDLLPVPKIPASELADNERMDQDGALFQLGCEPGVTDSQVVDPDRGVDDHAGKRRRRGEFASGSEPPRAARRRAFSRSINA